MSLIKRILADRGGQSSYYTLVDRIGVLARSARDLNAFLAAAADEFGRALDLTRSVILLKTEGGLKCGGEYSAQEINSTTREKLRLLDSDIARELAIENSPVEMTVAEAAPTSESRFRPGALDARSMKQKPGPP